MHFEKLKKTQSAIEENVSAIGAAEAARLPNKTTDIPSRPQEFVVELEVLHQLHCLNALRKTFYPDRYKGKFEDYFDADGHRNYTSIAAKHYGKHAVANTTMKC